jgi:CRP-like cAMP-binding protein
MSFTQLLVGNLDYVLLVISMMMTRMLLLRIFAIASGVVGAAYMWFWLHDPVGTAWETIFVTASLLQITLTAYRNRAAKFSDEEQALRAEMMPDVEPRHLRALLRIGSWQNAEPGTMLTRQGELAQHLIYLRSGKAAALVNGRRVGTCSAGTLVGEMGLAGTEPATASVVADECVRYFALHGNKLRKLMKSDPLIADVINRCSQKAVEKKLIRLNEAMQAFVVPRAQPEACGELSLISP